MSQQSDTTARTALAATQTASTILHQTLSDHSQRGSLNWAKWIVGIAFTGLSLSLLASGKAEAVSFTFEKIVDTNTPVPGGIGTFDDFYFSVPSLDNGNVAFAGNSGFYETEDYQSGIYTNIGGKLNVVADTNTPIPGGTGTFDYFSVPSSLDNGNVAFQGSGFYETEDYQSGIYTNIGGKLNVVADTNTPIPGGTGTFDGFSVPSLDNGSVAFEGYGGYFDEEEDYQSGIYTNIGGKLNVVADTNTPIPGGTGTFDYFSVPSLDNGNVAFGGSSESSVEYVYEYGIYTNIGGKLNVVVDTNTPVPGATGTFDAVFGPSLDNGNVAFEGYGGYSDEEDYQRGIYTNIGGKLNVVANSNTLIPGGIGTFDNFIAPSLDNGNVAFQGSGSYDGEDYQSGIYTNIGGVLTEVISGGDSLDGKKIISYVISGPESLSGNQIAFGAFFTDPSEGIYIATVPEPSSVLGTLAFSAFGSGWLLKRKLKKQKSVS